MTVKAVPWVSVGITALCVLGYLAVDTTTGEGFERYGTIPVRGIAQIGWITSMFVHAGLLHLLGNLVFLYLAAPVIEDAWGLPLFVVLYFGGGIVADGGQVLVDPGSSVPLVGASGAIAACMGALSVQFPHRKVRMFYWVFPRFTGKFYVPVWLWGGFWLAREVFDLVTEGTGGGVAFAAHVAGFVFGAAMAFVVVKIKGNGDAVEVSSRRAPDVPPQPQPQPQPGPEPKPMPQPVAAAAPLTTDAPSKPVTESETPTPFKPKAKRVPKAPRLRGETD